VICELRGIIAVHAQPVYEVGQGDEPAGRELVDGAFLAGGANGVGRQRAAFDVQQLVREGAAPLNLRQ